MTNPIQLFNGDKLKDLQNIYVVVDCKHENSHSQYPSHYKVECTKGPNKGRVNWIMNSDLDDYRPGGKFCEG